MSFKGVFLEGLEVVFIVITFGLNAGNVPLARRPARPSPAVHRARGRCDRRTGRWPASRRTRIKFAVGLLLTTFGTFWAVEGLGCSRASGDSLEWPGGDLALLVLLAAWSAFSWSAIRLLRQRAAGDGGGLMGVVRGFCRFWYDFIVGDDWRIALGVAVVLAVGAVLVAADAMSDALLAPLVAFGILSVVSVSIVAGARR